MRTEQTNSSMVSGDSKIQAVLLAAGISSRYGGDKLLVELTIDGQKQPLISHTLSNWLKVFGSVMVMVRPGHSKLQNYLETTSDASRIKFVVSKDAQLGMGHSIAAGVKSSMDSVGWVIGLADMPFIPSGVIEQVYSALMNGSKIALPVREQRRGHPVGFAKTYQTDLLALNGDTGAKAVISENFAFVTQIPTETDSIFYDIDKPSDLVNAPQFSATT